jgi:hypothetical protein
VVGDLHRLLVLTQLIEPSGQGGQDGGVEGVQALVVLPVPLADPGRLPEDTYGFVVAPQLVEAQRDVVELAGKRDLELGRVAGGLRTVSIDGLLEQNQGVRVEASLEQLGGPISHFATTQATSWGDPMTRPL